MSCQSDSNCPFLFSCSEQHKCFHNPVSEFSVYTAVTYFILIPLACGLVNTAGNSMGEFKVLIVMNILRYNSDQATVVSQSLVVGSAIPNVVSLILRKHPTIKTSLVNFNLVLVLIPCSLLGSTFGSFLQEFIPQIIQDLLIMIVFSYFCFKFFKKFQAAKLKQKQQKQQMQSKFQMSQYQNGQQISMRETIQKEPFPDQKEDNILPQVKEVSPVPELKEVNLFEDEKIVKSLSKQMVQLNLGPQNENQIQKYRQENKEEFQALQIYQNSIHLWDIVISITVFAIFQFFVFLLQGKLSFLKFSNCNYKYFTGLAFLGFLTLVYLKIISRFLNKKFLKYKKFGFTQQIDLSKPKQFILISLGGFGAGLAQGILGLGSGTVVMATLLRFPINPRSASATSGYQILFNGLGSLVQDYIDGQVNIAESGFYIGDCAILGGIITLLIMFYLRDKNATRVAKILFFIIFCLCCMSVIMVIPSMITNSLNFGWNSMISIRFNC